MYVLIEDLFQLCWGLTHRHTDTTGDFSQVVEGQELRMGRSYRLCVDRCHGMVENWDEEKP